jgi:outer membrane protein TolC
VALEVEEAFVGLTTAADQIRLFEEEILTQAEDAYRMYEFAYQQGEIEAMDLIEARRTLNDARTSYADALFNYDVARAAIERSVGRPLEEQRDDTDRNQVVGGENSVSDPLPGRMQRRSRVRRRLRGPGTHQ